MNKDKKIFAFIDSGIDGATSLLILKWLYGWNNVHHFEAYNGNISDVITNWTKVNDISKFDHIYIIDLDISESIIDIVNKKVFCIVDHHANNIKRKDRFTNCTALIANTTSCSKLLYNIFKSELSKVLTLPQKNLIALVDCCDSYTFTLPNSRELSIVYNNSTTQRDKVQKYINDFKVGSVELTEPQRNIVEFHKNRVKKAINELQPYFATFSVNKNSYKGVSAFTTSCINEVSDYILSKYKADISFVINTETSTVSLRRSRECNADLSELAKKLLNGYGYEYAAGGKLSDTFLMFSKIFKPVNESI